MRQMDVKTVENEEGRKKRESKVMVSQLRRRSKEKKSLQYADYSTASDLYGWTGEDPVQPMDEIYSPSFSKNRQIDSIPR